eukprot:c2342_g1_i1.p1 GENE.c2342_g1_i1~~c2342_g1_i1.p1  ORF type:complete len:370 (-),score=109.89 c2342_g1_i1:21-1130(-)
MGTESRDQTMSLRVFVAVCFALAGCTQALSPMARKADAMKMAIGACPCEDHRFCEPINRFGREVVAVSTDMSSWRNFDLKSLTTVSLELTDADLICAAHQQSVRVLFKVPLKAQTVNPAEWISQYVNLVSRSFVDGLHIDIDQQCLVSSPCITLAASILKNLKQQLAEIGRDRIMVTLPWSPLALDGRFHDFSPLAAVADGVFVVSSDTRNHLMDRCIAGPNAHASAVNIGINHYIDMGIPKNKLVLALSWLAYDYECSAATHNQTEICLLTADEKGCGDWMASRIRVDQIPAFNSTLQRNWDETSKTWYATYTHSASHQIHQVWFDDADSLSQKYHIARDYGIGGVGTTDMATVDTERALVLRTVWAK